MNRKEKILISFLIFSISFSVLLIQIIYSKIFSVLTYYHFSSMIISIALLGFGAAGSYISLKYDQIERVEKFIVNNGLGFIISNVVSFYLIIKLQYYPITMFHDWTNQVVLLFYYVALALPFFFAGKILSVIFTRYAGDIGSLYFFDLIGGGVGSFSVFLFLEFSSAPGTIHLASIILALAFMVYAFFHDRRKVLLLAGIAAVLAWMTIDIHVTKKMLVYPPPSKDGFQWAMPWKGSEDIEFSRWNVVERLDITKPFTRPIWDFGGDISPKYHDQRMELRYMFKDGITSTGILKIDKDIRNYEYLNGYLQGAPYIMNRYRNAVAIGFGGGIDLLIALYHRVRMVIGAEINPMKVAVLRNEYREYSGNLADKALLVPKEGRHYLSQMGFKVDVVQMGGLDASSALASGAFAMSENYLLTTEAVELMLESLNPDGVISINRILFDPPRETLRMVTTMIDAMNKKGHEDVAGYFYILRGNRWANVLLKAERFREEEVRRLNSWAEEMSFQVLYDPFDPGLDNYFAKVIRMNNRERKAFYREYPYKIDPATDNSPFFFQYYKWKNLFKEKISSWAYAFHMPVGLQTIVYSIVQITILGLIFIILPMSRKKIPFIKGISPHILIFFASIGLGFILIEIILVQKFIIFLGGPVYALSVVLFSVLVFSGLGSFFSRKFISGKESAVALIFGLIIVIGMLYNLILPILFKNLLHLSTEMRIVASVLILAPLSFLMGMPFPTGVRALSEKHQQFIPWAWAVNSIFTVFGSVFCVFLSLSFGFSFSWYLALVCYLLAMNAIIRLRVNTRVA